MHEAATYRDNNCFITLTYSDETLPVNNSLAHEHFQQFAKRMRWHTKAELRYYMCGEYGETTQRPHYHAAIFNYNFRDRVPIGKSASGHLTYDSKELRNYWQKGNVTVQDLTPGTAAYVAGYILKKQLGATASYDLVTEDGEVLERDPEYSAMSKGVGKAWYSTYRADFHTHDYAIMKGKKLPVPKYYDRLLKARNAEQLEQLKQARKAIAAQHQAEQTPDRLAVRETVTKARYRNKERSI